MAINNSVDKSIPQDSFPRFFRTPQTWNSANTSRLTLASENPPAVQDNALISSLKALPDHCGWEAISKVSSEDLEKSLNVVNTLGHGSMGLVDEVKGPNVEKVSFVRKRVFLPPSFTRRNQILKIVREEAKVVEGLAHTHIVHIIATYEHTPKSGMPSFSLLMFPVGDGDLTRFLHDSSHPNSKMDNIGIDHLEAYDWLARWFSCLSLALAYIHAHGIRHQDIKPSNIVHLKGHIFFTDFSSSSRFDPGSTTSTDNPTRASARYSAPEILDRWDDNDGLKRHGTGSDIFALGCVFMEMLAVITGTDPENLQQHLQEVKSGSLFRFKKQALQPGAGFCYSPVVSGSESFFKSLTTLPLNSLWGIRSGNGIVFFKKVIAPMVRVDRKKRPSALEVAATIAEANLSPICECGHAYLPKPKETPEPSAAIQSLAIDKAVSKTMHPPVVAPVSSATTSEQLRAFKDYYSHDEIQVGAYVSVLWAYAPRANDEFDLERGEMLLVVGTLRYSKTLI
jgi:serine/threonine protein kinase